MNQSSRVLYLSLLLKVQCCIILLFSILYYFNQNNTRYIPQAQICRLLNLFAHTQDPLKRINTHFAKYCKEENIESLFSASFWEEFYPILLK